MRDQAQNLLKLSIIQWLCTWYLLYQVSSYVQQSHLNHSNWWCHIYVIIGRKITFTREQHLYFFYTTVSETQNTSGNNWNQVIGLLEKAMAPHSSTLAWKIPWTEELGGLTSMRSLRVGHDWATSLSLFTLTHWRRKWQPTPVFLPGESQGQRSLVGCHLWGRRESDTTEAT